MRIQAKPDLGEKETIAKLQETTKIYKTSIKAVKGSIELEKKTGRESIRTNLISIRDEMSSRKVGDLEHSRQVGGNSGL